MVTAGGRDAAPPLPYPLARCVGITLVAGAAGLATEAVADAAGWEFPSVGHSACDVVWKLATLGVAIVALRRYEGRRLDLRAAGFHPDRTLPAAEQRRRAPVAVAGLVVCAALAVLTSFIGADAGDGSTYGEVRTTSVAVLLVELLVRYPITVVAEEALFRGVLYDRIGRAAPVVSGLLFAAYHLQQVSSILSLIPYGIAFGVLRWWTGDARLSAVVHYVLNAGFLLITYG